VDKRPPEMLMKKVLKERSPELTEANEQINWTTHKRESNECLDSSLNNN
jgi:hypothetical protein